MDKIYLKDNYVVTELGGVIAVFPKNYSSYSENSTGFYINSTFPVNNQRTVFIDFTRVTSVYNEAGTVAYSIATLRSFLLLNTGFKSPSGGSGGSTITVGTTPVTSGTDGRVFFQSGGVVQQDSGLTYSNSTGILQIKQKNQADGLRIENQSSSTNFLEIYNLDVNASRFESSGYHIFRANTRDSFEIRDTYVEIKPSTFTRFFIGTTEISRITSTGLGIGTTSPQARLDIRAQGALSTDLILRTRNSADTRNFLVVNGAGDVYNNGAGGVTSNTFYGENVGRSASGAHNTTVGTESARDLTTGFQNILVGTHAGRLITGGANNTAIGAFTLNAITSNIGNVGVGSLTLTNLSSGNSNTAIGQGAGRFVSGGTTLTTCNFGVFVGQDSRPLANLSQNEIVIGHQAIGTGSNSVTLGNTSITRTNLRGQVVISGFASAPTGVEGAIYYDSTTKKHYGFDGTTWNALY